MNKYNHRLGKLEDLILINQIIKDAKQNLKDQGLTQWQSGYPNEETMRVDIANKRLLVCCNHLDEVIGFLAIIQLDPCYELIYDGQWINPTNSYFALHRIATDSSYLNKGVASSLLSYMKEYALTNKVTSLRVDTHAANIKMQQCLIKNGFKHCGIILVDDKLDPKRMAFEYLIK